MQHDVERITAKAVYFCRFVFDIPGTRHQASAVVSQVTYSQAMELLEEVSTVPVTEMQISDSDVMIGIQKKVRLKRYQERQLSLLISSHTYRRILQISTVEYQITNNIH